ncbi:MAG: flagellar basal body rod protein FlgB [Roseburia sp.]|nr:flagellar basal body rod protein FlgB [Roseburia sp.]
MLGKGVFDYVNVLESSLNATSARTNLILNNLANANTPHYKRKDIRFETELKQAFIRANGDSVDAKVKDLDLNALKPQAYTDYSELSFRYDGNNVDINNEEGILAKTEIKYEGLMDLLNKSFSQIQSVLK